MAFWFLYGSHFANQLTDVYKVIREPFYLISIPGTLGGITQNKKVVACCKKEISYSILNAIFNVEVEHGESHLRRFYLKMFIPQLGARKITVERTEQAYIPKSSLFK